MSMNSVYLGEVAELRSGVGFPKRFQGRVDGDFPFAKVGDISTVARSGQKVLAEAANYIMSEELSALRAKPFPPGTIAFAKIGEAIRQNFRVIAQVPILFDNNVMGAIPNNQIDSDYLFHFLISLDLYCFAQSTTVPSLRKSELANIKIPLPPIEEQQRIAAVLDAVDALRAKRRETLEKLGFLVRSVFFDMFGDAGTTTGWVDTTIGQIAEIISGATPKTKIEQYWGGDVPWATPRDLRDLESPYIETTERTLSMSGLKSCSATLLPVNSVLLSSRAPIGYVAINTVQMATNQGFKSLVLDPARVDSRFLYMWLSIHRRRLEAMGNGATFKEISKKTTAAIEIPLPPIDEQRRFGGLVDEVEALRDKHRRSLAVLDELFGSLQQRAFRGELFGSLQQRAFRGELFGSLQQRAFRGDL